MVNLDVLRSEKQKDVVSSLALDHMFLGLVFRLCETFFANFFKCLQRVPPILTKGKRAKGIKSCTFSYKITRFLRNTSHANLCTRCSQNYKLCVYRHDFLRQPFQIASVTGARCQTRPKLYLRKMLPIPESTQRSLRENMGLCSANCAR